MIDRAAIFRKAWAGYRAQVSEFPGLKFSRKLFSSYLRSAWSHEKARVLREQMIAEEAEFAPAVIAIRSELRSMELSDAPINWNRHRELSIGLFKASVEHAAA